MTRKVKKSKSGTRGAKRFSRGKASSQAKMVRDRTFLWFGGAMYLGLALTGFYVAAGSQEMRELYQQVGTIQKNQDALLAEHSRLLLERSTHSTYQNIDRVAEKALHMKFPEVIQQVIP